MTADPWLGLNGITRDEIPLLLLLTWCVLVLVVLASGVVDMWRNRR